MKDQTPSLFDFDNEDIFPIQKGEKENLADDNAIEKEVAPAQQENQEKPTEQSLSPEITKHPGAVQQETTGKPKLELPGIALEAPDINTAASFVTERNTSGISISLSLPEEPNSYETENSKNDLPIAEEKFVSQDDTPISNEDSENTITVPSGLSLDLPSAESANDIRKESAVVLETSNFTQQQAENQTDNAGNTPATKTLPEEEQQDAAIQQEAFPDQNTNVQLTLTENDEPEVANEKINESEHTHNAETENQEVAEGSTDADIEKDMEDAATDDGAADLPEWELNKQYYTIGEVSKLFDVNVSHIRFWTKEFKIKTRTTRKGDRLYNPNQIDTLRLIYHLVKVKKFTLAGAKEALKSGSNQLEKTLDLREKLQELYKTLSDLRTALN